MATLSSLYARVDTTPTLTLTATGTLSATNSYRYNVNANGGSVTLTLPTAATTTAGVIHVIKRIDSNSSNTVTIARSGSGLTSTRLSTESPPPTALLHRNNLQKRP